MKMGMLAVAGAALLLVSSQSANAHIASLDGCYDCVVYDTPSIIFHNTSGFAFTNSQMVLKGYDGINNGLSQTVSLGTLATGDTNINWGTGGTFFAYDYDDSKGFQAPCPFPGAVNAGLCAQVGNFSVTFTALWDDGSGPISIFSQFSPHVNATGGFVGWEGIDPNGWSENPLYDVHTGTLNGVLAYIDAGRPDPTFNPNSVPEPATLAVLGLGIASFGFMRRKRPA